jgi:hypothetical protein
MGGREGKGAGTLACMALAGTAGCTAASRAADTAAGTARGYKAESTVAGTDRTAAGTAEWRRGGEVRIGGRTITAVPGVRIAAATIASTVLFTRVYPSACPP